MKPRTRTAWRWNALLSALLVGGVLVMGNRLARDHAAWRVDLSEDQLYALSPAGRDLLGRLEDVLQVKAFFTGEPKVGAVQIAKRRLIDQLEEFQAASGGRLELSYADPNSSSDARSEARSLGVQPAPVSAMQGTAQVTQDMYLGLRLRYRARELVLPFVLPQSFEYAFLTGLNKLQREEDVTIGFVTGSGDGAPDEFGEARRLLSAQYRLREVLDLARGEPVPADVTVLVVIQPRALHPRAAWAVDQFVQRGGRLLVLADPVTVDVTRGEQTVAPTGLEDCLAAWGLSVEPRLVWDQERRNTLTTVETVELAGREEQLGRVRIPYPFWPNVGPDGLDANLPVTARLPGADLFWAAPLVAGEAPPSTLERTDLVWTSEAAWVMDPELALDLDPAALEARSMALLAQGGGARRVLGAALSGRFPSAFLGGAPAPLDRLAEALHTERVRAALEAGEAPPERPEETTDEPVVSGAVASQVVVVGDADWARDGRFLTARNRMLFENLIDWLALEDDLIALRSRVPRPRTIDDFLEEERRALGLIGVHPEGTGDEPGRLAELESEAERRAARRRAFAMARATGGAVAVTALAFLLWRFCSARSRPVRISTGRPAGQRAQA